VPIFRRVPLIRLTERTCKWPLGDPLKEDFCFCGNDSPDTSPYCTFHQKLAYQPSAERRRVR
jgi:GcrA cell cycle regulator